MRGLGNLIIGLLFIIGGMGGGLVLRGTSSGGALAVLGLVLCVVGGVQLANASGQRQQ
ncbi:MAG: hypothetical protein IT380_13210 [Myxococcales bacterium]|nr:hypothetical protein [Myxococcales bacterium]